MQIVKMSEASSWVTYNIHHQAAMDSSQRREAYGGGAHFEGQSFISCDTSWKDLLTSSLLRTHSGHSCRKRSQAIPICISCLPPSPHAALSFPSLPPELCGTAFPKHWEFTDTFHHVLSLDLCRLPVPFA